MFRLIDQHDRDIVFDGVDEAAGVAHEHFLGCRAVFQWSLALRADKNLEEVGREAHPAYPDRKSTRLNSSHSQISYAVFCLKKKKKVGLFRPRGKVFKECVPRHIKPLFA